MARMRSAGERKAMFRRMKGDGMFDHLPKIKINKNEFKHYDLFSAESMFALTDDVILADSYRTDMYGRPSGTIGIGPGMGIAGGSPYAFSKRSKRC